MAVNADKIPKPEILLCPWFQGKVEKDSSGEELMIHHRNLSDIKRLFFTAGISGSDDSDVHSEEVLTKHINIQTLCPSHQEKVSELSAEKEALNEKLRAEEERRKNILSDKNLVRTAASVTQTSENLVKLIKKVSSLLCCPLKLQ